MGQQLSVEQCLKETIPSLDMKMHKGSCGRIAILGGSLEYTGAPYFSAITALRTGCDIAHVFCPEDAAIPIKAYSPELIVHPFFQEDYNDQQFLRWMDSIQVVVVGPGLGRNEIIISAVVDLIRSLIERNVMVVLDADGLWIVNTHIDLIKNKKNVVLTPNVVEYSRLCDALKVKNTTHPTALSKMLGGVTIIKKGEHDIISNGYYTATVLQEGSPRRCGGIGDLLSGSVATFLAWSVLKNKGDEGIICSCVAACSLVKRSCQITFGDRKRGMIASDIIKNIPDAFDGLFWW
ncbi:ATP-dependent (S)-NAD(P)H-hydrate dehydratase [Entamoeba marina]